MFRFHLPTISFTIPNLITIAISLTALFLTARNYLRKAGVHVRGVFTIRSSRECDDKFVSEVILENLKDRAITVFSIYLKLGYHCYVELENLEDNPLVLRAFETHQWHFGALELYSVNLHRIDINDLLGDSKVKKQLVLSTSDGKYMVPSRLRRWSPYYEYFKNYMTILAHPIRTTLKGKDLGGNVKYVVELIPEKGGEEEIALIYPSDYQIKRFREFALTQESLTGKDALEQFLQKKQEEGKLQSTKVIVHDMDEWRKNKNDSYDLEPVKIEPASAFEYYIIGRLSSKYSNWKIDRANRQRFKSQQAKK